MKHIVIDARIRRASSGRPIARLLDNLNLDKENRYTVLLSKGDDWQPKTDNVTIKHVGFRQFSFNPWDQIAFPWILYRLKPDVTFFGMTQYPLLYFGKIVVFTHDLSMFRYAHPKDTKKIVHSFKMLGYRLLFWAGHKKANKIIVPTKFVQKDLENYQPFTTDKIVQIYEAVDLPENFKVKKPLVDIDKEFIFYVGSAFPHKNLYRLIDSFSFLRDDNPNLQLVLAGKEDYYYEKLNAYVKSGDLKNIKIIGYVSDEEMHWLYQNALFFVYPSLSEGFGIPPLEAMANGCPVATSNTSCMPEVCGNAVEYFDPYDVNEIAQDLQKLINNPQKRKGLAKAGKEHIQKYSWGKMTEEILAVFNGL